MATFDAPNREVCTVRRSRTNTPLQALVTLNDPVYVEAAQALARQVAAHSGSLEEKAKLGIELCLSRPAKPQEVTVIAQLYTRSQEQLSQQPEAAAKLATVPLGPVPEGQDVIELAAWTTVGNVLLNVDELFMKR
jgi:Fe-S cluster assembly ATPase SufC